MLEKEIKEKITKNSVSLERHGINDLAWSKEDATDLIRSIKKEKIGILGGDVYKLTNELEALSDNWSCEPHEQESEEEYYSRSKLESLNYIEKYPINPGENILFSMVFTVNPI